MATQNLLNRSQLKYGAVEFDKIQVEDYVPAVQEAIKIAKTNIEKIKTVEAPTFENVVLALEMADDSLEQATEIYFNLYSAESTPEHQALATEISVLCSNFSSDVTLDAGLFEKIKTVYDQRSSLGLNSEQLMLLDKTYKGFVRNGALLDETKKEQIRKIDETFSKLAPKFSDNVLKATNEFILHIEDETDLEGLPESAIESAQEEAESKGKAGWFFTLHAPSLMPFLKFAKNRALREKLWRASSSRCVEGELSNQAIIREIVELRHKRAQLLGFKSHADYILAERMAQSPEKVMNFLEDLIQASLPAAQKDLKEVQEFAKQLGHKGEVKAWDMAYFSEALRQEKYSFNSEELRPYFSLEKVVQGAFKVAEKLYAIEFQPVEGVPVYHPDVKTYEVHSKSGDLVGLFYTDFFPRESKKAGAWMTSYREQGLSSYGMERPHVSIVCNFTKPTKAKPSLLTFYEVETLFHEFGHALHGLLSQCNYKSIAGTHVHWDFVELPSQFMENFLLEKEVLDLFAEHYETGEKIPQKYIDKLKKSAQFQSGWMSLRQLNFAYLDMSYHRALPEDLSDIPKFEEKATKKTRLMPMEPGVCASCAFSHIFAGGYSSGYYSYKWAEVLDADAFEFFKEKGLFNSEASQKFKTHILERGGTEHPMDLYKKFRGREPDPKALLRRDGLI